MTAVNDMMHKFYLIALGLNLIMAMNVSAQAADAREIKLALHWLPQAQFAGYYVALEKGFYREEGLTLTILDGGPSSVPADRLSSGEADFATMFLAAALERRSAGIPLINIAQIVQRSALMIITRKEDGIATINDLDGRQITMWGNEFQLQPWALFRQHDIKVKTVPFSGSMELFLRGAVSATLAMWYNDYHTILASGYKEEELQSFFFKDTGYNFPEDGLYCLAETAAQQPETLRAVVAATLKGWRYSFEHEEEALDIVEEHMRSTNLPVSRIHQRWMLRKMKNIIMPENQEDSFGSLGRVSFSKVIQTLGDAGFSKRVIAYEDFIWSENHVQ